MPFFYKKICENIFKNHNIGPRLGEFSPSGRLITLASFLMRITEIAQFFLSLLQYTHTQHINTYEPTYRTFYEQFHFRLSVLITMYIQGGLYVLFQFLGMPFVSVTDCTSTYLGGYSVFNLKHFN
jgi:hypothetical protein